MRLAGGGSGGGSGGSCEAGWASEQASCSAVLTPSPATIFQSRPKGQCSAVKMYTTADNNLAADRTDILGLIRHNRAGLNSLRDDHLTIMGSIRAEETSGESRENRQGLEERITAVSESLQQLEVK